MTKFNLNKAFRILRRNYGCPGYDGISIKEIKCNYWKLKCCIEEQLKNNLYRFSSPRFTQIYSGTKSTARRNIFVYSVFDRWVQIAIKLELEKYLSFRDSVFSYRKGKNKVNALKHLLSTQPNYLLTLDLKQFFESIAQVHLLEKLERKIVDRNLLQLTIDSISHCKKGLPLGNCISPLLANFYLSEIDEMFPTNFTRYSDDLFFSFHDIYGIDTVVEKINATVANNPNLELHSDKIYIYENPKLENIIDEFPWVVNTKHWQLKFEK